MRGGRLAEQPVDCPSGNLAVAQHKVALVRGPSCEDPLVLTAAHVDVVLAAACDAFGKPLALCTCPAHREERGEGIPTGAAANGPAPRAVTPVHHVGSAARIGLGGAGLEDGSGPHVLARLVAKEHDSNRGGQVRDDICATRAAPMRGAGGRRARGFARSIRLTRGGRRGGGPRDRVGTIVAAARVALGLAAGAEGVLARHHRQQDHLLGDEVKTGEVAVVVLR